MQISSQLSTAAANPASKTATSSPADTGPTFHEAFRTAATRDETAGKAGVDGRVSSEKSTAADPGKARATDAGSSATAVSSQSGATSLPLVDLKPSGQTLMTATYELSGNIGLSDVAGETTKNAAPAALAQTPAPRTGDNKSKKLSAAEGSTEASTLPANAPAGTPDVSLLVVPNVILPPPSVPVNEASASTDVSASKADSSVLPADAASPVLSGPANQETAGADVPDEGQSPAVTAPIAPAAILPATASADLVADAGRLTVAAPPKAAVARPGTIPASDAKPAAGTTAPSSKATVASVSNGVEAVPTPAAALGSAQAALPPQDASPLAPTFAVGTDRSSAGEVRGKRKDAAADSSSPERDSTTTAPAPFAARLAEAQAPAQAGANDPHSADPAVLQKALDGSQPLTSSISPAPAQTNLSPAPVASAAAAAPSVPVASADQSADPAALPGASSAQLIQSAGQTEMRLGMRSAEFGNISISTSVSHQAISAQISLDHSELGRALAVHLPAIEEKLGNAYGLHARVEVRDESAASRSATDAGQQGEGSQGQTGGARGGQGRSGSASSLIHEAAAVQAGSTNLAASSPTLVVPPEKARLDIRI